MKTWLLVLACVLSAGLAACGGGGGSSGSNPNQPNLTVSTGESVVLPVGAFKTFNVYGGVPPYQAVSNEAAIAVANIKGSELTIGGIAGGKTTVRVFDNRGALYLTEVTVGSSIPLYTSAPGTIVLSPPGSAGCSGSTTSGGSAIYSIAGGAPPYSVVSSDTSIVSVQMIDATRWRATATGVGSAKVEVRDAGGSSPAKVDVSVGPTGGGRPDLAVSPQTLDLTVGLDADVLVSGGIGPYRVAGGIPGAIQVSPSCSEDGKFKIKGVLQSELDVSFIDSVGSVVKTRVTVGTFSTQFRISPDKINISENGNEPLVFSLWGFQGDSGTGVPSGRVCVLISNPTLLALDPSIPQCSNYSSTNRSFTLVTGSKGSRCVSSNTTVEIRAVDALGQVATGTVTVVENGLSCGSAVGFSVVPASVSLSPTAKTEVAIRGGSGTFVVTSSNPSVVTGTVDADKGKLVLEGGASRGNAVVKLIDVASGAEASVNVSNGTSGFAALTISPDRLTVSPSAANSAVIGGGSGSFTVTSSDPLAATGVVNGRVLTVTGGSRFGSAELNVIDVNNPNLSVKLTVNNATSVNALTAVPNVVTVGSGNAATVAVRGGSGTYVATTFNAAVVTAAVDDKGVVTITAQNQTGSTVVQVTDVITGSSTTIAVQNVGNAGGLSLSSNTITLGVNASQNIVISGGSGTFEVTSADPTLVTVTHPVGGSQRDFVVTRVAAGATTVTVRDTRFGITATLNVN